MNPDVGCAVTAVLWLLLTSGAALKWAGLTPSSSRVFGAAQIALSSGIVVFGIIAVLVNSAWAIAACRVRSLSPTYPSWRAKSCHPRPWS